MRFIHHLIAWSCSHTSLKCRGRSVPHRHGPVLPCNCMKRNIWVWRGLLFYFFNPLNCEPFSFFFFSFFVELLFSPLPSVIRLGSPTPVGRRRDTEMRKAGSEAGWCKRGSQSGREDTGWWDVGGWGKRLGRSAHERRLTGKYRLSVGCTGQFHFSWTGGNTYLE